MRVFTIVLNTIEKTKDFINVINKYDFDAEIHSGKYIINAKSIMGIFSLDISKPVKLVLNTNNIKASDEVKKKLCNMDVFVCEYFVDEL